MPQKNVQGHIERIFFVIQLMARVERGNMESLYKLYWLEFDILNDESEVCFFLLRQLKRYILLTPPVPVYIDRRIIHDTLIMI